ncbi:CoA-transferase family III [Arthrobacter sp. cf158]|nr:CoA-transferase family III [Arthrobacter sp. cf158]
MIAAVERVFSGYGATELLQKLNDAGIPAGKVRSLDEVYAWEQVASQGLVVDVIHPLLGKVSLPGPPLRFFAPGDAAETTLTAHDAPPLLNEDGPAIRQWLGLVPVDTAAAAASEAN